MSRIVRRTQAAMGTMISVHLHLHDDATPQALIDDSFTSFCAELDRLESMFSTFRTDSEISRISRGELHLLDASPEVVDVLDACTWLEHASHGAFRARRPDDHRRIDPAGFVKGWATERATDAFLDAGLVDWIVSAGGDVLVHGHPLDAVAWDIAIAHPDHPSEALLALSVGSGAVATSGTAQRGEHVWNGRSGVAATELRSVTVTGPTLTWADAIATTVLAMGLEGIAWASQFDDHHVIALDREGRLLTGGGVEIDGLSGPLG